MKALKIFSLMAIWFALLFVGFSFCHYSFDAQEWGAEDRALMIMLWVSLSFCSTGYLLERES